MAHISRLCYFLWLWPDIRACGVWKQEQNVFFFDICLTNTNACSQKDLPVSAILKKHEKEQKRAYNSRIMNVEHEAFTPLVFSYTVGDGPETFTFQKQLLPILLKNSK